MVSKLWTGTEKVKLSFKNIRGLYSSLFPYNQGFKELLFLGLFYKKLPFLGLFCKKKLGSDKLSLVTDPKGQKNL